VGSLTLQENQRNKGIEKKARVSHACDRSGRMVNDDCDPAMSVRVHTLAIPDEYTPYVAQNTAHATAPQKR